MTLTLLAKPGCHLCDDLRALLEELQPRHDFSIEEIDITGDADLFARYRYEIPVVLRDGKEVARGRITEYELVELLRNAT